MGAIDSLQDGRALRPSPSSGFYRGSRSCGRFATSAARGFNNDHSGYPRRPKTEWWDSIKGPGCRVSCIRNRSALGLGMGLLGQTRTGGPSLASRSCRSMPGADMAGGNH